MQQGRSHDAVLLKARQEGLSFDMGGAYNQEKEQVYGSFYSLNNYKVLGFLWVRKQLHEHLTLSGLQVSDGFQRPDSVGGVAFRHTYGLDLVYKKSRLQFNGAFYRQSGEHTIRRAQGACLGIAELFYTLSPLKFTIGTNYLSAGFNTLYATNHKYYGYMDYFINIPTDTRNGGLQDNFLKVNYSSDPKYSLSLDYHFFALAKNLQATETLCGTRSKYLGSEIDAVLHYKYSDQVQFSLGYSTLLSGKSMEALKGGHAASYADWGWLMVNIQPKILLKAFDQN